MTTDKKKKVIIDIVYIFLIGLSLYFGLTYVLPIILPFVLGFAIAYALKPLIRKIHKKTKIHEGLLSFIIILLFYTIFVSLLLWLGIELFNYVKTIFQALPALYEDVLYPWLSDSLSSLLALAKTFDPVIYDSFVQYNDTILQSFGNLISGISESSVNWITDSASRIPSLVVNLIIMVISSFFISMDYTKIVRFLMNQLKPKHRELLRDAQEYLGSTIKKYMKSYLIIMTITFVELTIGFIILGIDKAIVIAFLIALFDVLPVAGTGGVMIPWIIITFMEGNTSLGIGLFVIYMIVTTVRNILEPKIIGDQVGLHPVITLLAMFIGTSLFGVVGMLSFPFLLSILKGLHDSGKITLYKEGKDVEKDIVEKPVEVEKADSN